MMLVFVLFRGIPIEMVQDNSQVLNSMEDIL